MSLKHLLAATSSLSGRDHRPEVMDQSGLDAEMHRGALAGLRRLNLASGVCRQICRLLIGYCQLRGLSSLRMLDIASGGGDVPFGLWKLAKRKGIDLSILGLDVSATACKYATERCRAAGSAIVFEQCDVVRDRIPNGFDVVTCSLFLHHLKFDEAVNVLTKMADAGHLLLANDLNRSATGYILAQLACRILTGSPVVRYDGPQSVANAFTLSEMRDICASANLTDARVYKSWPCRFMVVRQKES
ncbi:MAG TPA: methyltransferase domain-containing protein [Lacipirellulaceae bacterium]|jgi:2-polyprenyl-3-methyl-5-hydroxy-6-metoxy-1,4-benzoquinol methylase|nr:methyltransferase domain-containing protein [Lacipirellulaceae bacterium]